MARTKKPLFHKAGFSYQIFNGGNDKDWLNKVMSLMTIRAQQGQIVPLIIFAIMVYMMHFKYLRIFFVSTSATSFKQAQTIYFFANICRKISFLKSLGNSSTFTRAVLLIVRWRTHKVLFANRAFYFNTSIFSFVIALSATIFCSCFTRWDHIKFTSTNLALYWDSRMSKLILYFTASRAVKGSISAIGSYIKYLLAVFTNNWNVRIGTGFAFWHMNLSFAGFADLEGEQAAKLAFRAVCNSALAHLKSVPQELIKCH